MKVKSNQFSFGRCKCVESGLTCLSKEAPCPTDREDPGSDEHSPDSSKLWVQTNQGQQQAEAPGAGGPLTLWVTGGVTQVQGSAAHPAEGLKDT